MVDPNEIEPRGTVTAIAFKEGYREQVLLEVPVNPAGSLQELYLNPIVAGERNEPDVQPGSSHHLEILSLVEKYSKYFKKITLLLYKTKISSIELVHIFHIFHINNTL